MKICVIWIVPWRSTGMPRCRMNALHKYRKLQSTYLMNFLECYIDCRFDIAGSSCHLFSILRLQQLEFLIPCSMSQQFSISFNIDATLTEDDVLMFLSRAICLKQTVVYLNYTTIFLRLTNKLNLFGLLENSELLPYRCSVHPNRSGKGYARLLGGDQWSTLHPSLSLHLFLIASWSQNPATFANCPSNCLTLPTAHWDARSNRFEYQFLQATTSLRTSVLRK